LLGHGQLAAALAVVVTFWATATVPGTVDNPSVSEIGVQGTAFRVRLTDGRLLDQQDLVGAILEVGDESGVPLTVRIDGFVLDDRDPAREVVLYRVRVLGANGSWQEFCHPDPAGERWAFPVAGSWTASGEHRNDVDVALTCSSGAIGKCVRFGYKPWAAGPDGRSMWDLHQACVRMIRADYCGDGRANTRDGTRIEFYDRLGVTRPEPAEGMSFEAAWAPDGAVCVAHVRVTDFATLDGLAQACPGRLAGHIGPVCQEEAAIRLGGILFNKSRYRRRADGK
jgi:hypothetical protein